MRKIISLLISLCFTLSVVNAESLTKTISTLNLNKAAIAVSIKDLNTGDVVYELNSKTPMNPASTLKIITSSASIDTLGTDYEFSTKLYKSSNNDLYLKLCADPFLKTSDLEKLLQMAKDKNILSPKNVYVDSSIFDSVEWGEGWQWDDDLNILMPKYSAYNLDGNLLKVEVSPNMNNTPATITTKPFYPITFMNLVNTDLTAINNVKFERDNSIAPNVITATGVVAKVQSYEIPINNPKMYFKLRLEESIRDKKIDYFKPILYSAMPKTKIYSVGEINHDMSDAIIEIYKNSNNMIAETVFKLAGAKWANSKGTIENSLGMLNSYLNKLKLNTEDIKIVDGSGVSKDNLMTADFMTDFLIAKSKSEDFETFKKWLPIPGEGTMKNRMLYFKDILSAKTGTLSDTSSITGYITSRKGKTYVFDIMIKDAKTTGADKKNIEEQILRQVYANY